MTILHGETLGPNASLQMYKKNSKNTIMYITSLMQVEGRGKQQS